MGSLVACPPVRARLALPRKSQTAFVGVSVHSMCGSWMCLDLTPTPVIGTFLLAHQETTYPWDVCRRPSESPPTTAATKKIKLAVSQFWGGVIKRNKKMTSIEQLQYRR